MALAILGLLCFQTIFKIFCSSSVKNVLGNLIRECIESVIALGSIVILMILTLPIQEHGVSFYLFGSSLISFIFELYSVL